MIRIHYLYELLAQIFAYLPAQSVWVLEFDRWKQNSSLTVCRYDKLPKRTIDLACSSIKRQNDYK